MRLFDLEASTLKGFETKKPEDCFSHLGEVALMSGASRVMLSPREVGG